MGKQEGDLGKLELELMQVIWRGGAGTVAEIQSALSRPLAYTTVQTVLNLLQRKGKLRRTLNGRAYTYSAKVTESQTAVQALRDLIDRMFGGSSEELMLKLVETRQIDQEQIKRLQERLKERGHYDDIA